MAANILAWLQSIWDPRYAAAGASFAMLLITAGFFCSVIRRLRVRAASKPAAERATIDDVLTWIVAAITTAVSAEGSYRVFHDVLNFDPWLLWPTFAVIELIMLVSAFRARRYMRQFGTSGIDGIAVWVFAGITAALASGHALSQTHYMESAVRVFAPLASAYLWERGMRLARIIRSGRKRINWTFGLERILVRLGLAEPAERDTTEVAATRYLTELAKKTARLRQLETSPAGNDRNIRWATKRQASAMTRVLEHTDFATSPQRQAQLMAIYGALVNASGLTKVTPKPVWEEEPKTESPYPPIVVQESVAMPETVVMAPAPPLPVLAAANGNGSAPKRISKPRQSNGSNSVAVAAKILSEEPEITKSKFVTEAMKKGISRPTAYRRFDELSQGSE